MAISSFNVNPNFSSSQNLAIYVLPKISAPLSMIGSFIIIFRFWRLPKKNRNVYQRLLLGMSSMDFFGSLGFFLGVWTFALDGQEAPTHACVFQGWLLQINSAVFFYNGVLATNFLLRICYEFRESKVQSLEKYYHLFAWTYPLVTSFVALGLSMYGEAGPWCWIVDPPYFWAQMAFFFGPLWIIMVWSMFCMFSIVKKVSDSDKKIKKNLRGAKRSQRKRQVSIQAVLYVATFFLTWIFGSANRVYSHINGRTSFALILLHSFFVPLQGFFNFMVYLMPRYYAWKEENEGKSFHLGCKRAFILCFGAGRPKEFKSMHSSSVGRDGSKSGKGNSRTSKKTNQQNKDESKNAIEDNTHENGNGDETDGNTMFLKGTNSGNLVRDSTKFDSTDWPGDDFEDAIDEDIEQQETVRSDNAQEQTIQESDVQTSNSQLHGIVPETSNSGANNRTIENSDFGSIEDDEQAIVQV